jgi:hypothetical protein
VRKKCSAGNWSPFGVVQFVTPPSITMTPGALSTSGTISWRQVTLQVATPTGGTGPFTYRWLRQGALLPGSPYQTIHYETGTTFTDYFPTPGETNRYLCETTDADGHRVFSFLDVVVPAYDGAWTQDGTIPTLTLSAGSTPIVNDGVLFGWTLPANPELYFVEAFYTTDGSEPTLQSPRQIVAARVKYTIDDPNWLAKDAEVCVTGGLRGLGYSKTVKVKCAFRRLSNGAVGALSSATTFSIAADTGVVAPVYTCDFSTAARPEVVGYRLTGFGDLRTDFGYGGSASCRRFFWPAGAHHIEERFDLGEDLKEVWFEYRIFYPKGDELSRLGVDLGPKYHHPTSSPHYKGANNKFFALWDITYGERLHTMAIVQTHDLTARGGPDNGDAFIELTQGGLHYVNTRFTDPGIGHPETEGITAITDTGPIQRGEWVRIRIHARVTDSQMAMNGRFRVLANDTALLDAKTNLKLGVDPPYPRFRSFFRRGYVLGYANSSFQVDTSVYVDDFKIYNKNPGW